jgi:hypothetical protein
MAATPPPKTSFTTSPSDVSPLGSAPFGLEIKFVAGPGVLIAAAVMLVGVFTATRVVKGMK